MSLLFTPYRLRELELKNRVVVAPMATYGAVAGMAGDWHFTHLARFAAGGASLVFYEATAVMRQARIVQGGAGIWQDEHVASLLRITEYLRHHGVASALQLAHNVSNPALPRPWDGDDDGDHVAANEAVWNLTPATNAATERSGPQVHELSAAYIGALLDAYELAARRALEARFDVLEIHGGVGSLLHEFLSTAHNRRGDEYGGDLDSRMRLPLEVIERVRQVWPAERPLLYRLTPLDGNEYGWRIVDSVEFAKALQDVGVDMLDLASGGVPLLAAGADAPDGAQVETGKRLRDELKLPVMVGGGIRRANEAESALQAGAGDMVALGRELLWNPNWPLHAARELGDDPNWELWPSPYGWPLRNWRE
jgi:2,4-dienoyl-CoA reductase-like NADH-dependent reductase (Old Yellow Enzyme family)